MLELKALDPGAIESSLKRAQRYRLLNEPDDAESICLDILATTPDNQEALITLLLALTDKFRHSGLTPSYEQAQEIVPKLDGSYSKSYYLGVIYERCAKYHLKKGGPGAGTAAYGWFLKAMESFDSVLNNDNPKSQEAVLRWNSCARILNSNPEVKAVEPESAELMLDSFETPH